MRSRLQFLALAVSLLLLPGEALAAEPSHADDGDPQVGRYQLVVSTYGRVYVLDTVTGQCWSKPQEGRRWRDEGNPARSVQGESVPASAPLALELPRDRIPLTIPQRAAKTIPGANERIFIQLGDITGGQVLTSVQTTDGEVLFDEFSLEEGDVARFHVGEQPYYVQIKDLKNFVIGRDLAVVEIGQGEGPPPEREDEAQPPAEDPERPEESPQAEEVPENGT